jgi:uncharacterized membrane protein
MRRIEALLWFGIGLVLAAVFISFTSQVTAFYLTCGFAVVALVSVLGLLVNRK